MGDALLDMLNVVAVEAGYLKDSSKVTNEMLSRVSTRAGIRSELRKRLCKRELGNAVEAAVAYWFIRGDLTWEGMIEQLRGRGDLEEVLVAEIGRIRGGRSLEDAG